MEILCRLKEIFKVIYKFEAELKKKYNLSINEALTLCVLENRDCHSGEMAEEIGISVSRMSRVFSSLEKKGFVRRTLGEDDRRKMLFTLTENGRTQAESMRKDNISIPEINSKPPAPTC